MAHAQLSPSSAMRWMTCPGSVALGAALPDTSSTFADEGTAAHFLAAECLERELNTLDFIGQSITITEHNAHWAEVKA